MYYSEVDESQFRSIVESTDGFARETVLAPPAFSRCWVASMTRLLPTRLNKRLRPILDTWPHLTGKLPTERPCPTLSARINLPAHSRIWINGINVRQWIRLVITLYTGFIYGLERKSRSVCAETLFQQSRRSCGISRTTTSGHFHHQSFTQ